jgi:hypothetical protein
MDIGHGLTPSIGAPNGSVDPLSKVGVAESITSQVMESDREGSRRRYGATVSVAFMFGWKRQ